ncbi:MAG: uracil-DNA glycosylase [Cellulomonadaceae bacterium]
MTSPTPFPDLAARMSPDWTRALEPARPALDAALGFLAEEQSAGREFLPAAGQVLRAFERPLADVRVLIVGQDPYPTPGHATGLAFSVAPGVRPPASLRNVFAELHNDLGVPVPTSGDLTPWADQGVLLLNRVLSVTPGHPGSHRGRGWERVTDAAIAALVARGGPLVAVLWGNDAQRLAPALGRTPVVASPHPSPLSARRGFFGSRPFSRTNAALVAQGAAPIDWRLP